MKNRFSFIIALLIALVVGLGLGYIFFHSSESNAPSPESTSPKTSAETEPAIWTCSMHPQIRQPEAGDCPICGMDLIPLTENTSSDPLVLEMTEEAVKLANIETSVIGSGTVASKELTLAGKIQVDERRTTSQVAHVPGRIEELFVSFQGENVRKGQKIARIYAPELVSAQQELLEALKLKDKYPGLVDAARQKLAFWKVPQVQIEEIEKTNKIQEYFILRADAAGVVTKRRVAVGDYVKKGEILFEMVNLDRLWALFDVYEEDLSQVKIGDVITFTTPALPGSSFDTRITFIEPLINPKTRVAMVRGEIQNGGRRLKPEMFVQGELKSSEKSDEKLLVPKTAVLWTGKRSVVYVKVPDMSVPSFRYQEVSLGERFGNSYLVKEGLNVGDEVVTYGSFTIDAAAQLNNQASMMNGLINQEKEDAGDSGPNFRQQSPKAFKDQLASLAEKYLSLKNALVKTDSVKATAAAEAFARDLDKVDMSLLKGEAHDFWMEQLNTLRAHGIEIASDVNLEKKREEFSFLSIAMIQAVQALGVSGDPLYVQHCPMALDWEGADWLSDREAIRNPYFGDQMLKCGNVTGKIEAD